LAQHLLIVQLVRREACLYTQTIIGSLAILLERLDMSSKSPMARELGALTSSGKTQTLGVRFFYSGDPDEMSEHVAGMIT
jgi:hypothetical protein